MPSREPCYGDPREDPAPHRDVAGMAAGGVAGFVRYRHSERKVSPPDDGWSALVSGSPTADEPAAACLLAEPSAPANGSPRCRLDGSGCPVRQGRAEVFIDETDALVIAQAAAAASSDAASADLLLCRRAATAAPPTGRLRHA